MAQLLPAAATLKGKRKVLPAALKIDMTPMVDLGFLLITFFIFTSTMAESKATNLFLPKDGEAMPVKESRALSVLLLDNNQVYAYEGTWEKQNNNQPHPLYNQQQLRSLIQAKQKALGENKDDLMVLIKPTDKSRYRNMVAALDEMLINNVKRYTVVDASASELAYVNQ